MEAQSCIACGHKYYHYYKTVIDHFLSKEEFKLFQCANCGLLVTSPQPDKDIISSYYNSSAYISHHAQGKTLFDFIYRAARYFSIRKKFKIVNRYFKNGNVLDFGAGTGDFLAFLQKNQWNIIGVEPNPQAREIALINNKINLVESIEFIDSEANSFDVVTMWHSLEHTFDPDHVISEIAKVLKRNGILMIALPSFECWDANHYGEYWAAYDVPRHLFHFSVFSVEKLTNKYSFQLIEKLPLKLDAYYISLLSEKYKTGKKNYFNAIIKGFYSNMKAVYPNFSFSSLLYILRKL